MHGPLNVKLPLRIIQLGKFFKNKHNSNITIAKDFWSL